MEKYFCALELYCNLTPAELICHLLFYARAHLRKDNSCNNWSKGIIFTVFKRRQIGYCDKHSRRFWKNYKHMKWWPVKSVTENPACVSMINFVKNACNGWKSSMFILQSLLRTTNPENVGSIGLRTFAPIVSAHPYCARESHATSCHVMHRARALSTKMNKW